MKIKLIGCESTMNEIRWLGTEQEMDCEFLDYSYHARPEKLHAKLQVLIEASQNYDLIIMTYGRCSNSVIGLVSERVPLLLPGTHDCIGFLLGSNEKHLKMLKENIGTYYFSQGWLDYGRDPYSEYREYEDKYGEKRAKQIIEAMYGRYRRAVLIITPGIKDLDYYRRRIQQIADFFGWEIAEIEGDGQLISAVAQGRRTPGLIYVEPGQPVTWELFERGDRSGDEAGDKPGDGV